MQNTRHVSNFLNFVPHKSTASPAVADTSRK
jgi:hypothetical protein